jgi:hypothetical protein
MKKIYFTSYFVVFRYFLPVGLDLGDFSPSVLDHGPVIGSLLDFLLPCSDSFSSHRVSIVEAFSFPLSVFIFRSKIFLSREQSATTHSPGHAPVSASGLHFATGLVLPGPARAVLVSQPWILRSLTGLDAHNSGLLASHRPHRAHVFVCRHQLPFGLHFIAAIRLGFILFASLLLGSFAQVSSSAASLPRGAGSLKISFPAVGAVSDFICRRVCRCSKLANS